MYPSWLVRCAFRVSLVLIALVSTLTQFDPSRGTANQLDLGDQPECTALPQAARECRNQDSDPEAKRNCVSNRVRPRR